jgi:hypothetical protein
MTTKSEDAVKVLQAMRADAECNTWTAEESAAISLAIATLQQREAGAVALESLPVNAPRNHTERQDAEEAYTLTAFNYEANPVGSRDWTIYWRGWWHRAVIHPAQAASQEGEDANGDDPSPSDYRRCLKCGFVVDVALGSCKPGTDAPMLAHPTGDRVRGLVEKWRDQARRHRECGPNGAVLAEVRDRCADELTAAIDQEKNDGR